MNSYRTNFKTVLEQKIQPLKICQLISTIINPKAYYDQFHPFLTLVRAQSIMAISRQWRVENLQERYLSFVTWITYVFCSKNSLRMLSVFENNYFMKTIQSLIIGIYHSLIDWLVTSQSYQFNLTNYLLLYWKYYFFSQTSLQ